MSCSSLTSCQHGHVRTLSSTDEHVFARLGWIHDPVCSVALPTAVIPFTFRACPRSAVCCRIKPYHFCIQPGPRPRSPPSNPRTPPPPRCADEPARAAGAAARAPRHPGGCSVRHPLRLPAGAGGRAHARAGGGVARKALAGARRGVAAGLGGPRQSPRRKPRHHSRVRDCRLERPGTPPAPVTRPARPRGHASRPVKSVISQPHGNRQRPRGRIRLWPRWVHLLVFRELGSRVRPRDWSRARAILTTDNALARLSHSSALD
jgi:hypothetical protein